MPNPAKKPAIYADLEAVPPHFFAEILGGEPVFWTHALALWDFIEVKN